MLKITISRETSHEVELKLEGKVADQWAALLDGVCRNHLRKHQLVCLNCAQVEFVDASGVAVLQNLPDREVRLEQAPLFLTSLLGESKKT